MAAKCGQRDERLAYHLARGVSQKEAARRAGCSPRTCARKLAAQDFRRRVEAIRSKLMADAIGQLAGSFPVAVRTLRRLCKSQSETMQLGAARALVALILPVRQQTDLESRLNELERRIDEQSTYSRNGTACRRL